MRLKEKYQKQILPKLKKDFNFKNDFVAPRLTKVVINVGFGSHAKEKEYMQNILESLGIIAGQKAVYTLAKKSVSAFKIREGMTIGAKVTLRGNRMFDFVEKLVGITFPRVRDFRGISEKSVDSTGNLTIGIKDQAAFPEIKVENIVNNFGLEISLATTTKNRQESLELFRLIGFPFKKESK